jgi:hypothetical protein
MAAENRFGRYALAELGRKASEKQDYKVGRRITGCGMRGTGQKNGVSGVRFDPLLILNTET